MLGLFVDHSTIIFSPDYRPSSLVGVCLGGKETLSGFICLKFSDFAIV